MVMEIVSQLLITIDQVMSISLLNVRRRSKDSFLIPTIAQSIITAMVCLSMPSIDSFDYFPGGVDKPAYCDAGLFWDKSKI